MVNAHFEVAVNVTIFYEEVLPTIPSSFHLSEKKGGDQEKWLAKKSLADPK